MKRKQPDLSIIIPAYREERRIGKTLEKLADYLKTDDFWTKKGVEVIVVSADSPDRTHEIAESKAGLFERFKLLKPGPKVGKGRDVRYGMLRAKGKAVMFMDADLATPLHHIVPFYETCIENEADVVIATRNLRKHHDSFLRMAISNLGNIAFRIAGGVWVEDSQCGFKMFRAKANKICFEKLTIEKWGFDMELLAVAKANRLIIATHRVNDWKDMPYGTLDESLIKNSLHSLKDLAYITYRRITRFYIENHNN